MASALNSPRLTVVPGAVLRFSDDALEQEWRQESNKANERGDIWWFVGLIIWSISILRRWEDGGNMMARNIWFFSHLALCTLPMLIIYLAPKTYTKNRIPLVAVIRAIRVIGVTVVLGNNQNYIWKPTASQIACPLAIFASQYYKLAYLLCQVLAHQVPLIHHIWLVSLNAMAVLLSVPGRCQAECSLSAEFSYCSSKWLNKLAKIDKFWIFSAANSENLESVIEPWQAFTILQSLFAITCAIGPPLLYYATVEENWRNNFLVYRRGIPIFYDLKTALFLDTLLSLLAFLIIYNAIRLFI